MTMKILIDVDKKEYVGDYEKRSHAIAAATKVSSQNFLLVDSDSVEVLRNKISYKETILPKKVVREKKAVKKMVNTQRKKVLKK